LDHQLMLVPIKIAHPKKAHSWHGVGDQRSGVGLPPASKKGGPALFVVVGDNF
jgi:hypothetical protein